jgi:two-component system, OmpR family, sensor histidine kinase TctE
LPNKILPLSSLRSQLFSWLLLLLLPLILIFALVAYLQASHYANSAYDKTLYRTALALADQVKTDDDEVIKVDLPQIAKDLLEFDENNDVYFRIFGPDGDLVSTHTELPLPTIYPQADGHLYYSSAIKGSKLRVVVYALPNLLIEASKPVYIMVGETLEERANMADEIILSMLLPQLLIILLACALLFFVIKRGLKPVDTLKTALLSRDSNDLSPMDSSHAPAELSPLLDAFNDLLARVNANIAKQQRFVADASHQLKTPLAGLKTQAELAMREKDPAKITHALGQINIASGNLTHLVNQLLSLTKAEPEAAPMLEMAPVELCALAQTVTADWVTKALQNNIDLGFETSLKTAPIQGNAVLLAELMNNLIDNAILYTPAGGNITTGVKQQGNKTIFYVQDNGSGISQENQAKIFERFYRVLGTQKEGSGLGLTIVQEIANRHKASVQVESEGEGKGCLFEVSFMQIF